MKSKIILLTMLAGSLLLNGCSDSDDDDDDSQGKVEFTEIGGGLAVLDLESMELEAIVPLPTTETTDVDGNPTKSRFVHTYMHPDKKFLWMNNDGLDNAPDSSFRINIDPDDADASDGSTYLDHDEIPVGHGHKKSTFAYPVAGGPQAQKLFVTHNLQEESISIVDNDPMSGTFLQLIDTVDLHNGIPFQNTIHGMGFSIVSGHVYSGVTKGADVGLSIIDATDANLAHSTIQAGMDMMANEIPGAGYVKVTHDGRWVLTAGYVNEMGYLSVVDAQNGDTVTDVVELGNLSSSSLNIADMEMDMGGGMMMRHVKIFIPSRQTSGSDTEITNQIAVLDFDHMTGDAGPTVRYIDVGEGPAHRNGKVSPDGFFAYYPNGGDCGDGSAAPGPGCSTISVINVMSEQVIATLTTEGHEPGSVSVYDATTVDPTSTDKYYIFATDHEGYINVYTHDDTDQLSNAIEPIQPLNLSGGTISVREPQIANGKLFVPVSTGIVE